MTAEERSPLPDSDCAPALPSTEGERVALPARTFAGWFAQARGITIVEGEQRLFRESLFLRARLLRPLLSLRPGYFDLDRRLIAQVGCASTWAEFDDAVQFYADANGHWGLLRGRWRLRVSVRRLRRLATDFFPARIPSKRPAGPASLSASAPKERARDGSATPFRVLQGGWDGTERRAAPQLPLPPREPRAVTPSPDGVKDLQREIDRLKQQREILKRAFAIIAQPDEPPAPPR